MKKNQKQNSPANLASPPAQADEEFQTGSVEVVGTEALQRIDRTEIDIQIETAKKYARSIEKFQKDAMTQATQDEEVAESCVYNRPVGAKMVNGRKVMEFASGMSVRLAEIAASCFQNIRVYAMIVERSERFVRCRGMAFDVENNYASSSEAVEATVTRQGTPYSERMAVVVAKACLAKARRDAVFQVIPRGLLKPIETKVWEVLLGDRKSMKARRAAVMNWVKDSNIDPARVFASLGIVGEGDLGVRQLEVLTGLRTAIRDDEATIDDCFPPLAGAQAPAATSASKPLFEAEKAEKTAQAGPPADQSGQPDKKARLPESVPAKTYSAEERAKIIDGLKNCLLDAKVDERRFFDDLKKLGKVPDGIDELFALPTGILDEASKIFPLPTKTS
jgi:hypothetical protein